MAERKQMRLSDFSEAYGVPRQTVIDWAYNCGFPAYRLNKTRWYVDVAEAERWIELNKC